MTNIAGIPYFELELNKDVALVHPEQKQAVISAVRADPKPTDLLVISHGWNNDEAEARALYREFFANLASDLGRDGTLSSRRFAILGILWPSKKFAERDLIPGGAASAGNETAADAVLAEQISILEQVTGKNLNELRALVPKLADSKTARASFSSAVLALLPAEEAEDDKPFSSSALSSKVAGDRLLTDLARPAAIGSTASVGGAASIGSVGTRPLGGGAAGLGDLFQGIKAGAMNLLNVTTYYQMKNRAGEIGERGVNPVLREIRSAAPGIRLHLVGHSFGARVVTAAAAGSTTDQPLGVNSISLLQAAFSHFAFAEKWNDKKDKDGLFRRVISPSGPFLRGPMIVTHTRADKAVGIAYAIASRVGGQNASALGEANDPFGGLGGNGAQKTPEATAIKMKQIAESYAFPEAKVYNIDGNGVIGDHGDIRRAEVAHAVADALRAARA